MKTRKQRLLKGVLSVLGVSGACFLIQACYGIQEPYDYYDSTADNDTVLPQDSLTTQAEVIEISQPANGVKQQ